MSPPFHVDVQRQLIVDPAWDALVESATPASVFLTSGWLAAWAATKAAEPLLAVRVHRGDRLIAAAAFEAGRDGIRFAGRGASDYADVLIASDLNDDEAVSVLREVLVSASRASAYARDFDLRRMPPDSRAATLLDRCGLFVSRRPGVEAPFMCMSAAPEKLKKKSLVRHERGLQKRGLLECATWRRAADILPRLDGFFDLHVRRWAGTGFPSLFLREDDRTFYTRVTDNLGALDVLRYTEIRLDGHLLAAHYGFSWLGRFTWYKPCFDPEFARLSPGEVLIKRLIELAVDERATGFDFTIGNEAFKQRFATVVPCVLNAHVTQSRLGAQMRKVRRGVRRAIDGRGREPKPLRAPAEGS